jgi:hypothetical protein
MGDRAGGDPAAARRSSVVSSMARPVITRAFVLRVPFGLRLHAGRTARTIPGSSTSTGLPRSRVVALVDRSPGGGLVLRMHSGAGLLAAGIARDARAQRRRRDVSSSERVRCYAIALPRTNALVSSRKSSSNAAEPGALAFIVESDQSVVSALYLNEVEGRSSRRPLVVNNRMGIRRLVLEASLRAAASGPAAHLPFTARPIARRAVPNGSLFNRPNDRRAWRPQTSAQGWAYNPAVSGDMGFALGPTCRTARDDDSNASSPRSRKWWSGAEGRDLISPMVIANVTSERAKDLWSLGGGGDDAGPER